MGVEPVFAVVIIPPFVTAKEPPPESWKVLMLNVPPEVVVNVPFTVIAPAAVCVLDVLLNLRLL